MGAGKQTWKEVLLTTGPSLWPWHVILFGENAIWKYLTLVERESRASVGFLKKSCSFSWLCFEPYIHILLENISVFCGTNYDLC